MCNINTPFLHTGLYRWFGNLTQSAVMARGLVAVVPITASEDLHLALKQTFYFEYDIVKIDGKRFSNSFQTHYIRTDRGSQVFLHKIFVKISTL
jgi:hypothetical protein